MFCTECGVKVEKTWKHCLQCGISLASTNAQITESTSAQELLPPSSLTHWLAAGEPTLLFEGGEVVGFDFSDPETEHEYLRYAFWTLKSVEKYLDWYENGYPLLHLYFEIDEYQMPKGAKMLNNSQAAQVLTPEQKDIWVKLGRPRIFGYGSGDWVFERNIDAYRMSQIRNPIPDELLVLDTKSKIAKATKFLAGPKAPKVKKDVVVYLTSDAEFKQYGDRNSFNIWKKRGRPRVVVANGEPMYEVQWEFLKVHGLEMPGEMIDIWLWSGCPRVESWDYEAASESYYSAHYNAISALQSGNQGWAGLLGSLASGTSRVANEFVSNAQSGHTRLCMSCGRQVPSNSDECLFCWNKKLRNGQ